MYRTCTSLSILHTGCPTMALLSDSTMWNFIVWNSFSVCSMQPAVQWSWGLSVVHLYRIVLCLPKICLCTFPWVAFYIEMVGKHQSKHLKGKTSSTLTPITLWCSLCGSLVPRSMMTLVLPWQSMSVDASPYVCQFFKFLCYGIYDSDLFTVFWFLIFLYWALKILGHLPLLAWFSSGSSDTYMILNVYLFLLCLLIHIL